MAASGFEGFEKRLELSFSGDDPFGLRSLRLDALQEVLAAVQCSVVSAVGNRSFDSYVLSESSLFIYPTKMVIKTCGTTELLRAVPALLGHASALGLRLRCCRYTRGSFIFPQAQPFPHTSFQDEVVYLEEVIPRSLCLRKACVLPSKNSHSWHVYSAAYASEDVLESNEVTVEVCMTELDRGLARKFYRRKGDDRSGDEVGAEMTAASEIDLINQQAIVCGFAFSPCGYSMNGLDGARYSTIHVTPEEGHSYASYEFVGRLDSLQSLRKAVSVFRPGAFSVSVCMSGGDAEDVTKKIWSAVADAVVPLGMRSESRAVDDFPGAGTVAYQTFRAKNI